jgi:hypothetical protein
MAYPITRQFGPNAKGSELTFADMDNNLLYLDSKVTGSDNYIPMYSGSTYLTSSIIYQLGGNIGIGKNTPSTKLDVSGSTTITGSLDVLGTTTLIGNPTVNGSATITGSLNTLGTTALTGNLTVSGSTTITGSLRITGSVTSSNGMLVSNGGITSTGNSYFVLPDVDAFVLYSEYNLVNQLRIDAYNSVTYIQELDGEVNIGYSAPQGNKLSVNGSTLLSGSATITGVLTLPPVNPLPSGAPTGSLAVSGSGANCRIYFFNGSWNALF